MSRPIERLRARAKEGHAVVQFKDVKRIAQSRAGDSAPFSAPRPHFKQHRVHLLMDGCSCNVIARVDRGYIHQIHGRAVWRHLDREVPSTRSAAAEVGSTAAIRVESLNREGLTCDHRVTALTMCG